MGIKEISTARPNLMYDGPYIEMEEMTRTFLNGLIDAINSYLAFFLHAAADRKWVRIKSEQKYVMMNPFKTLSMDRDVVGHAVLDDVEHTNEMPCKNDVLT